jgi:hypothetical protein
VPEQSFIGSGGGVFTYTLPLPAGIADQVKRGELLPADGGEDAVNEPESFGDNGPLMPPTNAAKRDWVAYAVACGAMSKAEANKLAREQIIAALNPDLDTAASFARAAG